MYSLIYTFVFIFYLKKEHIYMLKTLILGCVYHVGSSLLE